MILQETKDQIEIWKTVKGFHEYEVSSLGRIRTFQRSWRGRILKQNLVKGYYRIKFSKKGRHTTLSVHRVVMTAFKGDSKLQVNHKNGIKTDNRVINLEYLTCRANIVHYHKERKTKYPTGVCKPYKKYQARIMIDRKRVSIGYFSTIEAASNAYQLKFKSLQP